MSLHTANTALVYFVLKRLRKRGLEQLLAPCYSPAAAFLTNYWNFGTIFELLAALFSFAGLWLWTWERRAWPHVVFASLLLFLAMKSKEMAVAMPVVWFCYDLIVREKMDRKTFAHWMLPGALAFSYGLAKALTMKGSTPTDAYYMSINGSSSISGLGIYFNMLFRTNFSVQFWCTALLSVPRYSSFFRETASPCSSCCTFLSLFLPVIFLINHRFAFYWYLPFLGLCGLAAILTGGVASRITARNPQWLAGAGAYSIFALLCWGIFFFTKRSIDRKDRGSSSAQTDDRGFVYRVEDATTTPPQAK